MNHAGHNTGTCDDVTRFFRDLETLMNCRETKGRGHLEKRAQLYLLKSNLTKDIHYKIVYINYYYRSHQTSEIQIRVLRIST